MHIHNKALYWFTNDLRLADNPLINQLVSESKQASFVYVFDENDFKPNQYQTVYLGTHRKNFILESLLELATELASFGHQLLILYGKPQQVIEGLVSTLDIDALYTAKPVGSYESTNLKILQEHYPKLQVVSKFQNTLFQPNQLLSDDCNLSSFSKFRKFVESAQLPVNYSQRQVIELPHSFLHDVDSNQLMHVLQRYSSKYLLPDNKCHRVMFIGGEYEARQHIKRYFLSSAPSTYKETRNELDGWSASTKFSPYLSIGNISPNSIWHKVTNYEDSKQKNDSTYWIKFELLWREYFHWLAYKQKNSLYRFNGQGAKAPLTCFLPERFNKWKEGNTPFPIVNACMKQLNATGFMSNRGRQIVASCLVNELGCDWRFGAAYFQQQLIDHDVASNWGNWQYIAGVGANPRGVSHFNIEKQTQLYDPEKRFITKWQGDVFEPQLDSVDMVDWPQKETVEL